MNFSFFYPKVLIISPCGFNHIVGGGITFSNLFRGWPKERLAMITGDRIPVSYDVCNHYYFLSPNELTKIYPFSLFYKVYCQKRRNQKGLLQNGFQNSSVISALLTRPSTIARSIIGEAGIPDCGILSSGLREWIKKFQPDLIYTILGTKGYIELVEQVQREFNLPLIIESKDDGVTDPRKRGIFGRYIRRVYNRKFRSLLSQAVTRIAICDEMALEYQERYGYPFITFLNPVDIDKWFQHTKRDISIRGQIKVSYVGSILPYAQLYSLKDCCQAVAELSHEGFDIRLDIYTPLSLFKDYANMLVLDKAIYLHDAPDDETFLKILRDADILLLPANFDSDTNHFFRLSMPGKIPAYLASGTPILVYGPADFAQVRYARREGWGYIVSKEGVQYIKKGLLNLINNRELREKLSTTSRYIAQKNHDSAIVRSRFHAILRDAAHKNSHIYN